MLWLRISSWDCFQTETPTPNAVDSMDVSPFVIFSQDVQVEKPDPKIFQITAEKAGCELTQMLHVGDSLKKRCCRRTERWRTFRLAQP